MGATPPETRFSLCAQQSGAIFWNNLLLPWVLPSQPQSLLTPSCSHISPVALGGHQLVELFQRLFRAIFLSREKGEGSQVTAEAPVPCPAGHRHGAEPSEPTWMKATVTTMSTAWGQRGGTAEGTERWGWGRTGDSTTGTRDRGQHHGDKGHHHGYKGQGTAPWGQGTGDSTMGMGNRGHPPRGQRTRDSHHRDKGQGAPLWGWGTGAIHHGGQRTGDTHHGDKGQGPPTMETRDR